MNEVFTKKKMTKKIRKCKDRYEFTHGITLVSLVVTVVILIILAGVSLNLTLGENGLFTIAKRARENIELSQIEEQSRMNELYDEMEQGGYYENPAVGELEGTIEELNKTIDEQKVQLENAKQEKQELQSQIENLESQVSNLQGQVDEGKSQIQQKQKKIDELTGQVEEGQASIQEKQKEIDSLKNEKNELEKQVAAKNTTIQEKENEIDRLTEQVTQEQASIQEKQKEIDSLKNEKNELEKQVAVKDATIQEKEEQIKNLQQQLTSKETELASKDKQIKDLETQKSQLESQKANLEKELAQSKKELEDIKEKEVSVNMVQVGSDSIPVPKGFYYVGGTKTSGVVISDRKEDENKYKNVADVPAGVIYDTSTGIPKAESKLSDAEKKTVILGNQFVWIPVTEEQYIKTNWGDDYKNSTWETQTNTAELMQIKKYGGFYVGRYEAGTSGITLTSGSTKIDFAAEHKTGWEDDKFSIQNKNTTIIGNITCKAGEIPYYHADYFTALKLCNRLYENSQYVQSGLVTGTMWDAMLNFIAGNDKTIVTTNCKWGNYNGDSGVEYKNGQGRYATVITETGNNEAFKKSDTTFHLGIRTTASSENVKKNNLYDVAGNLFEWTQETGYINNTEGTYMLRSGGFNYPYSGTPACYRAGGSANSTNLLHGFRPVLYIR